MARIAATLVLVPIGLVVLFSGTFETLMDRDIVVDILVATMICTGTYGVVSFVLARILAGRPRPISTDVFALILLVIWIPCLFIGIEIASLIPLVWGHAGEMFLVPFFGASPAILVWGLATYKHALISNQPMGPDASKSGACGSS